MFYRFKMTNGIRLINLKYVRDVECIGNVIRFNYPRVPVHRSLEGFLQHDFLEFKYDLPEDAYRTFFEIETFIRGKQLM
jgi:hypothetical protein